MHIKHWALALFVRNANGWSLEERQIEGITFPYTHPPEAAINVRVERTFYFFYFGVISRAKTHNSVSVCVCSLLPYLPIRSGDCCHAGNSWTHERMTTRRYCAIVVREGTRAEWERRGKGRGNGIIITSDAENTPPALLFRPFVWDGLMVSACTH